MSLSFFCRIPLDQFIPWWSLLVITVVALGNAESPVKDALGLQGGRFDGGPLLWSILWLVPLLATLSTCSNLLMVSNARASSWWLWFLLCFFKMKETVANASFRGPALVIASKNCPIVWVCMSLYHHISQSSSPKQRKWFTNGGFSSFPYLIHSNI